MLKSELISNIQKKHKNLSQNDIELITNLFFKKITKSLNENNNIEIRGFGTFKKKVNKSKLVRNPKTNEKVAVPEKKVISWKMSKELFKKINDGSGLIDPFKKITKKEIKRDPFLETIDKLENSFEQNKKTFLVIELIYKLT